MDLTDELRIADESPDAIMARLATDTNAGIDPTDPTFVDLVEGGFWDDLNRAVALEIDRLYDRLNEVVAAAIPALSWGAFLDAWADSLGLSRNEATAAAGELTFSGSESTVIPPGTVVVTEQTSPDQDPPAFRTTQAGVIDSGGTVTVPAVAVTAGSEGNVPPHTVTIPETPIPGVSSVTNEAAMTGGSDVETDEQLSDRIKRKLANPSGPGNAAFYEHIALDEPGVGFVDVQPNTPAAGNVTVLIRDVNGDPAPQALVDRLQEKLDPSGSSSQGAGMAPIGATVIVDTPSTVTVDISAELVLEPGYSLDGSGGTVNVTSAVEESLARYVNGLPAGADVIHNKVIAAIVSVPGVADVDEETLEIEGSAADYSVNDDEVAALGTVTLAEAD